MKRFRTTCASIGILLGVASLSSCNSKTHQITWQCDDGTVLLTEEVPDGQTPIYHGDVPKKESTKKFEYTFNGWKEEIVPAYSDAIYHASFSEALRKYTIYWQNEDRSVLKIDSWEYGATPVYTGVIPLKKGTESKTYEFGGWKPEIQPVTDRASYYAYFNSDVRQYEITWKNEDGTVLSRSKADYGSKPVYEGEVPSKSSDDYNDYNFASWSPAINESTKVTGDITYTAKFSTKRKTATIQWLNYDGSVLEEDKDAPFGYIPTYDGATPVRPNQNGQTFVFDGWEPSVCSVMGDATYRAKYKKETIKYEIKWVNYDGNILSIDHVPYGETPSYTGVTPFRPEDDQYSYVFDGWDKEIAPAYGDMTFRAKYMTTNRKYTIKWVNYNGEVLEVDENVPYGEAPSFDSDLPKRNADSQFSYSFSGWSPNVDIVKGDATYRATYSKTDSGKKYTVTWLNYDGTLLQTEEVQFYTTPSYSGEEPQKESDEKHSYVFKGWDHEIKPVTGNVTYTALFAEAVRKYKVNWTDWNGTILKSEELEYGTMPQYNGEMPHRKDSDGLRYKFNKWLPSPSPVAQDQTYKADYWISALYTITFCNEDGTVLSTQQYEYGEKPVYNGDRPSKPSTKEYSYEFAGWNPDISSVTGNQTCVAKYNKVPRKYKVTWKNYDGSVLKTEQYEYGRFAYYSGSTPVRSNDQQYSYEFTGWDPNPDQNYVRGDAIYTAQYSKTLYRAYVSFDLNGGRTRSNSQARYSELSNGKDLFYDVTKSGYVFIGWSYNGAILFDQHGEKVVSDIKLSENMTLIAAFGTPHTLTLVNESSVGGTLSGDGQYVAGQSVAVTANPKEGYQFDGWKLEGNEISTEKKYLFTMPDKDYTLTGSFSLRPYQLSIFVGMNAKYKLIVDGYGNPWTESSSGFKMVKYTSKVTVTAVSKDENHTFLGWYDGEGNKLSETPLCEFEMPCHDYNIEAKWK